MESLVTAHQLSQALNIALPSVLGYTHSRLIPFVTQTNNQYKYSLSSVQAALAQGVLELKAEYISRPFTYQDFISLPETMQRTEILDGVLVQEPSPLIIHQLILTRLYTHLSNYFSSKDPEGIVFVSPVDVLLTNTVVLQPDLLFISGKRNKIITESRINGPPDLAIEIISPSSIRKDRVVKYEIYRRFAIPHYWMVDAPAKLMEIFTLEAGEYIKKAQAPSGNISVPGFPDLTVDLDALWA